MVTCCSSPLAQIIIIDNHNQIQGSTYNREVVFGGAGRRVDMA